MSAEIKINKTEEHKKTSLREKIYTCFILAVVLFCIILLTIHPFVKIDGGNLTNLDVTANIGWKYEDGTDADLEEPLFFDGKGVLQKDITSVFTTGKDLCFETSNLLFRVYLNDEQIYEFYPEMPFYYGKYYGEYTHYINIPYFKGTGHLRIEYEVLAGNSLTAFRDARFSESNEYQRSGIGSGIFQFALCFSTCIIGLIVIITGLIFHSGQSSMIETVSLGALAILVSCFLMQSTNIWQLLFLDSALPRLTEFIALALIPAPIILFVSASMNRLDRKIPVVVCTTSFLLLAGIIILLLTGIADFSMLLIPILLNIVFTFLFLIIASAVLKKKTHEMRHRSLMIAFTVLMITGFTDITFYFINRGKYLVQTLNIGLAIFVFILAIYEIRNNLEINRINSEADAVFRLARVDGLTGLGNRLAFDEAEKALADEDGVNASLTLLDINYLKSVNDLYGHKEGDRHIRAAASVIKESFGKYGECFRIGGDEFFSIIRGDNSPELVHDAMNKMAEAIDLYNETEKPPIKLNIACGTASYEFGFNTIEEAEKLADSRMYSNKKRIKEGIPEDDGIED